MIFGGHGVTDVMPCPRFFLLGGFRSPSVLTIPWLWLRPRRACLCFVKRVVLGWAFFLLGKFGCFLVGGDEWLGGFVAGVMTPVGLHEDGVDLFEVDGFGLVAHGF
jgi:hypothetical protein